jgi:hypothetical protein
MLDNVKSSEMCLQKVKNQLLKKVGEKYENKKTIQFLLTNMRMSICEMG